MGVKRNIEIWIDRLVVPAGWRAIDVARFRARFEHELASRLASPAVDFQSFDAGAIRLPSSAGPKDASTARGPAPGRSESGKGARSQSEALAVGAAASLASRITKGGSDS